jgi:putative addiction module component (TIGR02574 family)
MSKTAEELLRAAQALSAGEQVELITALIAGLDEVEPPPLSPEWMAEIQRRSAAYDRGETTAAPWAEVRARLQARMKDRG